MSTAGLLRDHRGMSLNELDRRITDVMAQWGVWALRYSLALIFIWFGILKPVGLSPAEPLLLATTSFLPVFEPRQWLALIGWWEVAIGLAFLSRLTIRMAIALLALQMVGTFLPLFILPGVTFQPGRIPYAPTMEGQYIVKNLLIISAALVVGSTVRRRTEALPASDRGR